MLELWMFVLAIAVLLIVLAAIVSWEAFRWVRARAKARPRPRSLDAADTRSLAHYLGHICNAPDSAFIRFNAERLRSTTRRDVGSAIAAPFSRCVSMRDTVSIVSPK